MSRLHNLLLLPALLLICLPTLSAAPTAQSAMTTLKAFAKLRGDSEASRVVGMVGFNGQDQPHQWLLLQLDAKVPNLLHEYVFRDGRLEAQRRFWRDPKQDLPSIPITFSKVAIDSAQAFRLADQAAKRAGIGFEAMHFQLRNRDLRTEPIWVLNLIDNAKDSVGVIYISAITGETLRSVWYRPGAITSARAPTAPPSTIPIPRTAQASPKRKGLIPQLLNKRRSNNQPPPPAGFTAPPVPPRNLR